jgi:hypothetical protein
MSGRSRDHVRHGCFGQVQTKSRTLVRHFSRCRLVRAAAQPARDRQKSNRRHGKTSVCPPVVIMGHEQPGHSIECRAGIALGANGVRVSDENRGAVALERIEAEGESVTQSEAIPSGVFWASPARPFGRELRAKYFRRARRDGRRARHARDRCRCRGSGISATCDRDLLTRVRSAVLAAHIY